MERMTRFELATLTLAKKKVMSTVRTVRLLPCSALQSVKPWPTAWPLRTILAIDRFSISRVPTTTASS